MFLGVLMGILVVVAWGYLLVQHMIQESGPRQFPAVAHESLLECLVIAVAFLVVPFVGACRALRLVRSGERSIVLVGWFMLVTFSLLFLFSCLVYWSDYQRYASTP